MGGVDRFNQSISTYMFEHRSKKCWWSIFRFCVDLYANNAIQIDRHQKESPGQKHLTSLGSDVALLTRITSVTGKPPKLPCFQGQERNSKFLMKLDLTN